jgi:hypothetical protein
VHSTRSPSDKVYQLLAHGRWFSPGIAASSTNKTGRRDIGEISLKVALNTATLCTIFTLIPQNFILLLFQIKQCDKCQRNNPLKSVVRELHPIKVNDKLIITCFCDTIRCGLTFGFVNYKKGALDS